VDALLAQVQQEQPGRHRLYGEHGDQHRSRPQWFHLLSVAHHARPSVVSGKD
jgi:hypothetical protein